MIIYYASINNENDRDVYVLSPVSVDIARRCDEQAKPTFLTEATQLKRGNAAVTVRCIFPVDTTTPRSTFLFARSSSELFGSGATISARGITFSSGIGNGSDCCLVDSVGAGSDVGEAGDVDDDGGEDVAGNDVLVLN